MTAEKLLFMFVLIAATPLAYTRSRWPKERAFSDDYEPPVRHRIKVSEESENEVNAPVDKVCRTEECHEIARNIVDSMNESVDPCENFYKFTCGRWAASNPILPSNANSEPTQILQDLVDRRISEILKKDSEPDDILPVKQAKKWYRSCMDTENLERRGISPIVSFVAEVGGWPIAMKESDWDYEKYPWQKVESLYAHLTSYNAFYSVIAGSQPNGSKIGEIAIVDPELFLARIKIVKKPAYLIFLKNAVKSFVKRTGVVVSHKTYEKEARELVDFEAKLAELMFPDTHDWSKWVNSPRIGRNLWEYLDSYGTFDEFVDAYGSTTTKSPRARIHWQPAIQALFDPLNITIDRSSTTYLKNIDYITGLGRLLKKTKLRTIVNYVHWNYIFKMLSHTTESMRDEMFKINIKHLSYGTKKRAPRWQECVKGMGMTYAAAYVFTKKYFPESIQIAAREMTKNIKIALEADVDHSNWLDENDKSLAKDKIRAMKMLIGYPEWYNNATAITNYYNGLTIGTKYLDNVLSHMRFVRKAKLMAYTMPEDEDDTRVLSYVDPITVNAEYYTNKNAFNVPPAIFQSPPFTPGLPEYVNYGQIGFTISHEMGHAFDSRGIWYGKDGNPRQLSINIMLNYYRRVVCFVRQFDRYFVVTAEPEDTKPEDAKPEDAKPEEAEPEEGEPEEAEPEEAQHEDAKSQDSELEEKEPEKAQPEDAETEEAETEDAEPEEAEPKEAEPEEAEREKAEREKAEPEKAETEEAEPEKAETEEAEPEDVEPENEEPKDDWVATKGWKTNSENIADSIGLGAAFRAYKNLDKTQRDEPKLPGLERFTEDQLFFIAFGASWCFSETAKNAVMMEDDPHSPPNFRVNGAVSNTNDFAEAFGCSKGSAMNPSNKCNIWEKPGSTP